MKGNMRVTWTRVGGPHPQTTGWFDPQVDTLVSLNPVTCPYLHSGRYDNPFYEAKQGECFQWVPRTIKN